MGKPYNDDKLEYDLENHIYILTLNGVKKDLGADLTKLVQDPWVTDKTTAAKSILRDISNQVYGYIYRKNPDNKLFNEWLLAHDSTARVIIRNALEYQLKYIIMNGKIDETTGIANGYTSNNALFNLSDIRDERSIHPQAIEELRKPMGDNGEYKFGVLFRGTYQQAQNPQLLEGFYRLDY